MKETKKQVYIQVNHCDMGNTYSLYTLENEDYKNQKLHRFDGYPVTDNPNTALHAAVQLRKQGYQLIQMERYKEAQRDAEAKAVAELLDDIANS